MLVVRFIIFALFVITANPGLTLQQAWPQGPSNVGNWSSPPAGWDTRPAYQKTKCNTLCAQPTCNQQKTYPVGANSYHCWRYCRLAAPSANWLPCAKEQQKDFHDHVQHLLQQGRDQVAALQNTVVILQDQLAQADQDNQALAANLARVTAALEARQREITTLGQRILVLQQQAAAQGVAHVAQVGQLGAQHAAAMGAQEARLKAEQAAELRRVQDAFAQAQDKLRQDHEGKLQRHKDAYDTALQEALVQNRTKLQAQYDRETAVLKQQQATEKAAMEAQHARDIRGLTERSQAAGQVHAGEIATLTRLLDALKNLNQTANDRIRTLEEERRARETEIQKLTQQATVQQQKITQLKEEASQAQIENLVQVESLERSIAKAKKEKEEADRRAEDLTRANDQAKREIEAQRADGEELNRELADLRGLVERQEEIIKGQDEIIKDQDETIQTLQASAQNSEQQIRALEKDLSREKEEGQRRTKVIDTYKTQLERAKAKLDSSQTQHEHEIVAQQDNIKKLMQENGAQAGRITQLMRDLEDAEGIIAVFLKQLEGRATDAKTIEGLKKEIEQVKGEYVAAKERLEKENARLDQAIKQAQLEIAKVIGERDAANLEVATLKEDVKRERSRVEGSLGELRSVSEQNSERARELNDLREETKAIKSSNAAKEQELTARIAKLEAENAQIGTIASQFEEQAEALRADVLKKQREFDALTSQQGIINRQLLQQKAEELDKLRAQNQNLGKTIEGLERQLSGAADEMNGVMQELHALGSAHAALGEQHGQLKGAHNALQQELDLLQRANTDLQERIMRAGQEKVSFALRAAQIMRVQNDIENEQVRIRQRIKFLRSRPPSAPSESSTFLGRLANLFSPAGSAPTISAELKSMAFQSIPDEDFNQLNEEQLEAYGNSLERALKIIKAASPESSAASAASPSPSSRRSSAVSSSSTVEKEPPK